MADPPGNRHRLPDRAAGLGRIGQAPAVRVIWPRRVPAIPRINASLILRIGGDTTALAGLARWSIAMPEPPPRVVLVVEADVAVRRMLAAAFRRWGMTGHLVANGADAVEYCRTDGAKIGLVLMEVGLPGMDGPTTLQALRALHPNLAAGSWVVPAVATPNASCSTSAPKGCCINRSICRRCGRSSGQSSATRPEMAKGPNAPKCSQCPRTVANDVGKSRVAPGPESSRCGVSTKSGGSHVAEANRDATRSTRLAEFRGRIPICRDVGNTRPLQR